MPTSDAVPVAYALAARDPAWRSRLSPAARALLRYRFAFYRRADQTIPDTAWRTCGLTGGRGFGKSRTIAEYIKARVRAGRESLVALMAPTEDRIAQVQIKSLVDFADPDFKPKLKGKFGLVWPNGVEAIGFPSTVADGARGQNISLSWCTEIVAWNPSSRLSAFKNLYTATRRGEERIIWDSTAMGRNEVRSLLEDWHAEDPASHVILPGTTFDNPLLSTQYLRGEWRSYAGVRRAEELLGESFRESEGALFTQAVLDAARVASAPADAELEWICVAVDPAFSSHPDADETGILEGARARGGHAYVLGDHSGRHHVSAWAPRVIDLADPRKLGPRRGRIVIERKVIHDAAEEVLRSRAESVGLRLRVIGKDDPWPDFERDTIHVREVSPQTSKGTRADGPAAETDAGRVHLVDPGHPVFLKDGGARPAFADLETECTTFVPGVTRKSPNRLDAFAYLVIELRDLRREAAPDREREASAAAALHTRLDESLRGRATPGGIVSRLSGAGAARVPGRRIGL